MRLNPDQIYPLPNGFHLPKPCHPDRIQAQIQQCLKEAEIPPRYACTCFETLDPRLHPAAFALCQDYATTGWCQGKRGLLLIGPPGTGKTSLAIAILHRVAQQHQGRGGVHFWNASDGLEEIRRSFNRPEAERLSILELRYNRLLVLDDLGKQQMTDWVGEQFYSLINALWNEEKQVVVTTNLSRERFTSSLDEAVLSRLLGMCHEVVLEGPDQRSLP